MKFLHELDAILSHLYSLTRELSGRKYVTMSLVYPFVLLAKSKIAAVPVTFQVSQLVKDTILNEFVKRWEKLVCGVAIIACMLDPRFKTLKKCGLTKVERKTHFDVLRALVKTEREAIAREAQCARDVVGEAKESLREAAPIPTGVTPGFNNWEGFAGEDDSDEEPVDCEVDLYLREAELPLAKRTRLVDGAIEEYSDPLAWWKIKSVNYPTWLDVPGNSLGSLPPRCLWRPCGRRRGKLRQPEGQRWR